jgi:cation diffusion facilitator family transporter
MDTLDIRADKANHVTWVGFFTNLALVVVKLFAGIVGHSAAMVADALHSLSDFATDIVVLLTFRIIRKPIDKDHDYGHGKFETLATTIIGIALLGVGAGIFWSGAVEIWNDYSKGTHPESPGWIALAAAVLSILTKESLYRYTAKVGRQIDSQAVRANAWHHRSDALSSVAALIGIGGAIVLGDRWHVLDPIAAVAVSLFIVKVAVTISAGGIRDLMETSLDEKDKATIIDAALGVEGVSGPHNLRTRRIGNRVAVDLHIRVNKDLTVQDSHTIASQVESKIRSLFGQETFISVHVEPEMKPTPQPADHGV